MINYTQAGLAPCCLSNWSGYRKLSIYLPVFLFFFSSLVSASENGLDGYSSSPHTNDGASCLACHTQVANQTATLTISGPSVVNANSTSEYIATLSGGPAKTAGIDISVDKFDGTLQAVNGDLRVSDRDLTHRVPKAFVGGPVQFRFRWKAPTYNGSTTIFAAGNSSSGNRDLIGDAIASAKLQVEVRNGSGVRPIDPDPGVSLVKLQTVATGLHQGVSLANAGDGRMFVVDQTGKIKTVQSNGTVLAEPFLDIASRVVQDGGEQGLLGLAFHPNYASNGFLYVHYIAAGAGGSVYKGRVSRFTVSTNPQRANVGSEKILLEIDRNAVYHNGGDLRFGKDGYLYISSGDDGQIANSQNRNNLKGKILRIDVNGVAGPGDRPDCGSGSSTAYRIPPGNAYRNGLGNGCDEIFALGLRNPWRISLDRSTGDLWIGDVGQSTQEEIDFVKADTGGGANFGWPCYEGQTVFHAPACSGEYINPVHVYGRSVGRSVTGGFVYRGNSIPSLRGRYVFTDYAQSGKLFALVQRSGNWQVQTALNNTGRATMSSFGEDASGELYVISRGSGELLRIVNGNTGGVTPKLSVSGVVITEGINDVARVRVTLSSAATGNVSVTVFTSAGTAQAGSDYVGQTRILAFSPGQTSKDFDVTILDDAISEPQEAFSVRLIDESGAEVATRQAQVTIRNDDSAARGSFSVSSVTIDETEATARLLVRLSGAQSARTSVSVSTVAGTAIAGEDFYGGFNTLQFPAGTVQQAFDVPIIDDNSAEPNETFQVRLFDAAGADIGNGLATVTIVDDDVSNPQPQINVGSLRVTESAGEVTVPVSLTTPATQVVTFSFSTRPGSAEAGGKDFYGYGAEWVFQPGQRVRDVPVFIVDDDLSESTESLFLNVLKVEGATAGNLVGRIDIVDDEAGEAGFKIYPFSIDESIATARVLVTLSRVSNVPVTVRYATENGTAVQGQDFFGTSGVLTFAPGQTSQRFDVTILNDNINESSEQFGVRIYSPTGAELITPRASVTINDDD